MYVSGSHSSRQAKLLGQLKSQNDGPFAVTFLDGRIAAFEGLVASESRAGQDIVSSARSFLKKWHGLFLVDEDDLATAEAVKLGFDRRTEVVFTSTQGPVSWLEGGCSVSFDGKGRLRSVRTQMRSAPEVNLPSPDDIEKAVSLAHRLWATDREKPSASPPKPIAIEPQWLNRSGKPRASLYFEGRAEDGSSGLVVDLGEGSEMEPVSIGVRPESIPYLTPIPAYHINATTQCPDFVDFAPQGCLLPEATTGDPEKVARAFFKRYPSLYGTGDPDKQLSLVCIMSDPQQPQLGTTVVFQQLFAGVPVYGCQLRVHLSTSLAILSLSGTYYRDPGVSASPAVKPEHCLEAALAAWSRGGRPKLQEKLPDAKSAQLTIFPSRLMLNGGNQNHLTWQFGFFDEDIFVSAETGQFTARLNRFRDVINILDSNQRRAQYRQNNGKTVDLDECSWGATLQLVNGVLQVAAADLDAEATRLSAALDEANAFWRRCGRNGWDNGGGDVSGYVDATFVGLNAQARPIGAIVCSRGMVTEDLIGHELTHHVISSTSNLCYVDESGAANESYADVFGNLMFAEAQPDWPVGEGSAAGIVRNMRNPQLKGQPATYAGYKNLGPDDDDGGVHLNSGILNRAAVLLSDGEAGSGHSGIGRSRMARLYFDTMTKRLTPWSQFIDVLHNTLAAARELAATKTEGVDFPPNQLGRLNKFRGSEEAEVLWAFDKVGLSPRWARGWFKVSGSGTMTQRFYTSPLGNGETVEDVTVIARRQDNQRTTNQVKATGPLSDTNSDSSITLTMTIPPVIGTATALTEATVTSPNFIELYLAAAISRRIPPPNPGAPPQPALSDQPTPLIHHYPVVGGFYKYEDTFFSGQVLPPNCIVEDVELELWRRSPTNPSTFEPRPGPRHRMGETPLVAEAFGASIVQCSPGTGDLTVKVNCWHGVFVSCRYRLIYWIRGNGCRLPAFAVETQGIFGLPS